MFLVMEVVNRVTMIENESKEVRICYYNLMKKYDCNRKKALSDAKATLKYFDAENWAYQVYVKVAEILEAEIKQDQAKQIFRLTMWQKISLFPFKLVWLSSKGRYGLNWLDIAKYLTHEHRFSKPIKEQGIRFLACDCPGCNVWDPVD